MCLSHVVLEVNHLINSREKMVLRQILNCYRNSLLSLSKGKKQQIVWIFRVNQRKERKRTNKNQAPIYTPGSVQDF